MCSLSKLTLKLGQNNNKLTQVFVYLVHIANIRSSSKLALYHRIILLRVDHVYKLKPMTNYETIFFFHIAAIEYLQLMTQMSIWRILRLKTILAATNNKTNWRPTTRNKQKPIVYLTKKKKSKATRNIFNWSISKGGCTVLSL